jgi:3-oxoacyl-[acyl-carrier-protein] synthase II
LCLEDSGLKAEDIDYISATADSTLDCDAMETTAVKNVFGERAKKIPISSIKSMLGETFSASGAMNLAGSLGVFEYAFIPPTINYEKPDRRCDLDYVANESRKAKVQKVLIDSFSPTGVNSSLAIGRYE